MLNFVLGNWKTILPVLTIFALLGTLWFYGVGKYKEGYEQCTSEYEIAAIAHDIKTDKVVRKIQTESQTRIEEVENAPEHENDDIGPLLGRTLDGLRQRHGIPAK